MASVLLPFHDYDHSLKLLSSTAPLNNALYSIDRLAQTRYRIEMIDLFFSSTLSQKYSFTVTNSYHLIKAGKPTDNLRQKLDRIKRTIL